MNAMLCLKCLEGSAMVDQEEALLPADGLGSREGFLAITCVVSTAVGYAGGQADDPVTNRFARVEPGTQRWFGGLEPSGC